MAHLWTEGDAPWDAVTLWLCRDIYSCVPSVLRREGLAEVLRHLTVLKAENYVSKLRKRPNA